MAEIELRSIQKTFGARSVVEHLDLTIDEGEFVVLLGPSGCGKTTTLRIVAGLEQPTAGELYFDGICVNPQAAAKRNVGMVFQNYALYPHMTVRENLAFGLQSQPYRGTRRQRRHEIHQRVDEIAKMLELGELLRNRPKELSGGQKQRVALGRALIRNPSVFLMDEPLSNLDANLRDRVRMELLRIRENFPVTTIYVTHDQGEALTLANRIVVMNEGRVRQVATPAEIYSAPADAFVARFVGSPGMNLWTGPCREIDGVCNVGGALALSHELRSECLGLDSVTVGIRPEHLVLGQACFRGGASIRMEVDIVERLGSHLLVHGRLVGPQRSEPGNESALSALGAPVVVRLDESCEVARGDLLSLGARVDQVHLFDAVTGLRISRTSPPILNQRVSAR